MSTPPQPGSAALPSFVTTVLAPTLRHRAEALAATGLPGATAVTSDLRDTATEVGALPALPSLATVTVASPETAASSPTPASTAAALLALPIAQLQVLLDAVSLAAATDPTLLGTAMSVARRLVALRVAGALAEAEQLQLLGSPSPASPLLAGAAAVVPTGVPDALALPVAP